MRANRWRYQTRYLSRSELLILIDQHRQASNLSGCSDYFPTQLMNHLFLDYPIGWAWYLANLDIATQAFQEMGNSIDDAKVDDDAAEKFRFAQCVQAFVLMLINQPFGCNCNKQFGDMLDQMNPYISNSEHATKFKTFAEVSTQIWNQQLTPSSGEEFPKLTDETVFLCN